MWTNGDCGKQSVTHVASLVQIQPLQQYLIMYIMEKENIKHMITRIGIWIVFPIIFWLIVIGILGFIF